MKFKCDIMPLDIIIWDIFCLSSISYREKGREREQGSSIWTHIYYSVHGEVREQLLGVNSALTRWTPGTEFRSV